jgi:dihydroflavonol-4-reductase
MPPLALVTGATGFVGRHLVDLLRQSGWSVRALVRNVDKFRRVFPDPHSIDFFPGDLTGSVFPTDALREVGIVFHLAGVTKVLRRREFYSANHEAARRLYASIRQLGTPPRIVHVSSLAAAGPSPTAEPPDDFPVARPVTHYGRSKLMGEEALREILPDAPWTIIRPPVVFGPADTDVLHFFRAVARGVQPILGHDGKRVSLLYVRDLAAALVQAAGSPAAVGNTYYPAYDRTFRWSELGAVAARALGRSCRPLVLPMELAWAGAALTQATGWLRRRPTILNLQKIREASQDYWVCSPAKASRDFGFAPGWTLETAFAETIAWYRDHEDLPRH